MATRTRPAPAPDAWAPITQETHDGVGRARTNPALTLLIAVGIFVASFFLSSFRQGETIDINSDEATYAIEAVAFNQTGMTMWDGSPFLVHPPLHFVIEAAYFRAVGVGNSFLFHRLVSKPYQVGVPLLAPTDPVDSDNVFNAIMKARYLSIFYGAVIAVLLFFLGSALMDTRLGLLASALFILDPYILRRNHFNMLEPLTTLWGLAMIFALYTAIRHWTHGGRQRWILFAGVFFGLSLLSKELAILYIPGLVLLWLARRLTLREVIVPSVLGGLIYTVFPLWAALSGNWSIWWDTKSWLFRRLSGMIVDTGITRPDHPVGHTLGAVYGDYWPTFLLLGVAGVPTAAFLFLYLFRKVRDLSAELLSAFVIGCYGFFLVVWRIGGVINEQFFYLLVPITFLLIGYSALAWPTLYAQARANVARKAAAAQAWGLSNGGRLRFDGAASTGRAQADPMGTLMLGRTADPRKLRTAQLVLLGGLGILLAYNAVVWVVRYGFSTDNSYAQVEGFLAKTLPPGSEVLGRDPLDLYLLPKAAVYTFFEGNRGPLQLIPGEIVAKKIPYAILNDQALVEGYAGANAPYYDWTMKKGQRIHEFKGRLWNTYVYQIDYSKPNLDTSVGTDSLSFNKPAVASSVEPTSQGSADLVALNAFDGRAFTRWASAAADNQWIYVDLGAIEHIGKVELNWERAYATSYQIQVSDDAQNWTEFGRNDRGAGGFEVIQGSAKGRYVRLLMDKRATRYGFSLWEISVYP